MRPCRPAGAFFAKRPLLSGKNVLYFTPFLAYSEKKRAGGQGLMLLNPSMMERVQKIRLFASDLDGTFLSAFFTLNEENARAAQRAKEAGLHICAITARNWDTAKFPIRCSNFSDVCVTANGASMVDVQTGQAIDALTFSSKELSIIAHAAAEAGCSIGFYAHDATADYVANKQEHMDEFNAGWLTVPQEYRPHRYKYENLSQMLADFEGRVLRICLHGPGFRGGHVENKMNIPGEFFETVILAGEFVLSSSHSGGLDILPYGATKLDGLRRLAAHLGVEREEIMTFGDNPNDVRMLEWSGIGVAVENADECAKRAADLVTGRCDERGVAEMIEAVLAAQGR